MCSGTALQCSQLKAGKFLSFAPKMMINKLSLSYKYHGENILVTLRNSFSYVLFLFCISLPF